MTLQPFEVVVLPFPYSDRVAEQRRPALVVSRPGLVEATGRVWVAMITTSARDHYGDARIVDIESAGLPLESRVRASKLATVEAERVVRRIGALAAADRAAAAAALEACAAF